MMYIFSSDLLLSIFLLTLFGCADIPQAEYVELPPLFSDHMVLQRNAMTPVWGKATPGQQVMVRFKNQQSETTVLPDSSWRVYLAPEPAGGPYVLHVIGRDTITINDVLVGEVWLGSGQSNMQWSVQQSANAEQEIQNASYSNIRLFSVERTVSAEPLSYIPSDGWKITSPETIPSFSAVAYYFGRTLHDSLNVPVGLIHSSWGGTPAEAWTSAQALQDLDDFTQVVEELDSLPSPSDLQFAFSERMNTWLKKIEEGDLGYVDGQAYWASPDFDDRPWPSMVVPQLWEEKLPGYDGIAWFRKSIVLPETWHDQKAILHLANIDDADITWVNGVEVGRTQQYNKKREYNIPSSLLKAGKNTIAVRVLDTGGGGGIWGEPSQLRLEHSDDSISPVSLKGEWQFKSTLDLRDVASAPPRPRPLQHTPTMLYNAMIYPLIPYRIKGVIWYQGESNAGRAHQYRSLFSALISDWRFQWDVNIAFHFVQLANYLKQQENPVEPETWPELREAQSMALALPNTGMAVTIDIGEADDIHPTNKQDVGYRLALNALYTNYDRPIVPAGPLYQSMKIVADTIEVVFEHAINGMKTLNDEPIKGFAIAGDDQVFHWADASVVGNTVKVFSENVKQPVAVRYGWANNPIVNLYNEEGLPASPFRTDEWPGITEGRR